MTNEKIRYLLFVLTLPALSTIASPTASPLDIVNEKAWIHGAEDCSKNSEPAIDVLKVDSDTFILRQNKCLHYEAPFIYVLFGENSVFIQDTGATADANTFPLYKTVRELVDKRQKKQDTKDLKLIVSHSHSHSDHYAGDDQFEGKPNVTLIKPDSESVHSYFGFANWPQGTAKVELGGRTLEVIPLPGHQKDAVAIYDPQTHFILTGDSFYPGRLYIKNWPEYKHSMNLLLKYANAKPIKAFLGTHIEMSSEPGQDYPMGATYQPDESPLPLQLDDLSTLVEQLTAMGDKPTKKALEKTIIYPID